MKFALNETNGNLIKQWKKGEITINSTIYNQNMIISANRLIADWTPIDALKITLADLTDFMALKPELILLGTGEKQQFPEQALFMALYQQGIGLEVMNSKAACRTYNILLSEGRHVVAGIFK